MAGPLKLLPGYQYTPVIMLRLPRVSGRSTLRLQKTGGSPSSRFSRIPPVFYYPEKEAV
jgi:hypothetical protein